MEGKNSIRRSNYESFYGILKIGKKERKKVATFKFLRNVSAARFSRVIKRSESALADTLIASFIITVARHPLQVLVLRKRASHRVFRCRCSNRDVNLPSLWILWNNQPSVVPKITISKGNVLFFHRKIDNNFNNVKFLYYKIWYIDFDKISKFSRYIHTYMYKKGDKKEEGKKKITFYFLRR